METWLLLSTDSRHLAADLRLLELKYRYSPYLIIAGFVLVLFMAMKG